MSEALIVFAREPRLGEVKQRLAAGIGEVGALQAYRRLALRTLRLAATIARERRGCRLFAELEGASTACDSLAESARRLGARVHRQSGVDLGARMLAGFRRAERHGAARVVLLGCDCAGMRPADLRLALDALRDHDWILGPTLDGGYWLIGMTRPLPGLFRGMGWGGSGVAEDTRERARRLRLRGLDLPVREDIDHARELETWLRSRRDAAMPEPELERYLR